MFKTAAGTFNSLVRRVGDVREGEGRAVAWSALYFFLLLASYYILRPVRDEMGLVGGARDLPWLYTGTLVAMLALNPPFAWLVSRFPRSSFITYANRFFLACILLFCVLIVGAPESATVWVARSFFVWVSVFNMFVVSIFWAFMADLWRSDQGKRLFGLIGVGGTLGAILGSSVTALLVERLGTAALLLASAALLELAVRCAQRLAHAATSDGLDLSFDSRETATPSESPSVARPAGYRTVSGVGRSATTRKIGSKDVLRGITLITTSPYLAGICLYMFLFTLTSTFAYFLQANIVEAEIVERQARTAFFAWIDVSVNVLTLGVQLFLTGRMIGWLGVALTLAVLPAVTVAGFSTLAAAPALWVIGVFQILRRGLNYALARPAREVLYTVVDRDAKYKAKSLIDTFVYRFGDWLGALGFKALQLSLASVPAIALVAVPLAVVWGGVGVALGRHQQRLAD
jgi:AAA family ATP:ADP antiporter